MGGILAAIAAGPRPVEVPTVQDLQARNMQLQAMAQQGMLRQQEAALTGMKMQEAQLDFAERNALMGGMQRAIADPSNKAADGSQDWNKTYSALQTDPEVTANSRPQTLSGLRSAWLSQQKEMQEYSKSVADQKRIESETAAKNQEIAEKGRDIIGNWAQGQIDKGETSAPVVAAYLLRHRTEFPDGQNEIDAELNALQKNPDQAPAILQDWAQGRSAAAVEAYSKAQTGEAAAGLAKAQEDQIGRASCRERV